MNNLFTIEIFCCRLYWSDPGMGSIFDIHLSTLEKRLFVAAKYSAQLYGITVFQVHTTFSNILSSLIITIRHKHILARGIL